MPSRKQIAAKKAASGTTTATKATTPSVAATITETAVKSTTPNISNYTQDESGKWYDKTTGEPLGTGGTNAEWSAKQGLASSSGSASNVSKKLFGTYENDLDRLTAAQRQAQVDQLKAARTKALANLDVQEQAIKPMYQNARNQTSAASQQGAKSFAEYLANRGLGNSGAAAQGEINRLSSLQNNLGNLNTAEANAYRDIANQRTAIENDYAANLANANNAITTNYYNNLLNYNEQQRQYLQNLQQQALGQYANDYQAYMNTLDPNSVEYWQAAANRGNKVNALYNSAQQNALNSIQAGNINYNNAAALGWTVPQAEQYYNNYMSSLAAQAEQQQFQNNLDYQKVYNDTLKTQYDINKPYNSTVYHVSNNGGKSNKDDATNSDNSISLNDVVLALGNLKKPDGTRLFTDEQIANMVNRA